MAKIRVDGETREEKFKRVATARTKRILKDLHLLGNCSSRRSYSYSKNDANRIFAAIEAETKRIKIMFNKPKIEFSL